MYKVGDSLVHRSHGVGKLVGIESRIFSPEKGAEKFYIMEIADNGAPKKIFIPVATAGERLRPLSSGFEVKQVLRELSKAETDVIDHQTWNRRYREYMELVNSGEVRAVAKVFKSLMRLKDAQDLSFGERKLLDCAFQLLVKEVALSLNVSDQAAVYEIEKAIGVSDE